MVKLIMFDLDGTLLPMDQMKFVNAYFGGLAKRMLPFGYKPEAVVDAVTRGVGAMMKNDGSKTNSEMSCSFLLIKQSVKRKTFIPSSFATMSSTTSFPTITHSSGKTSSFEITSL